MSDIRQWLEKLGLDQYADAFEENAIVADVLADLSDADLEKLGVLMGHRKALLKAIASLSETDAASEAEATASATAVEAVGSTAPETARHASASVP